MTCTEQRKQFETLTYGLEIGVPPLIQIAVLVRSIMADRDKVLYGSDANNWGIM